MGDAGKKVGETALKVLCFPVYHIVSGIKNLPHVKGVNGIEGAAEQIQGDGNQEIQTPEPKPKNAEEEEAEEKEVEEKEAARDITNQQANTARKAAYQAAINAGTTPAQAQSAADAQTPIGNYAGNYAALSGAGANARAAYRERQGYADALSRETENLENARTKAIIAAALSGGGSGAQTGLSLFGN